MAPEKSYDISIWMKLMIGDFLKETMTLNTEMVGAYTLLSIRYWTHGPLKDDPEILASITKLSTERFNEMKDALAQLFDIRDGKWHHAGWDYLREEAADYKQKRSAAAKYAASIRWPKDNDLSPGLGPLRG